MGFFGILWDPLGFSQVLFLLKPCLVRVQREVERVLRALRALRAAERSSASIDVESVPSGFRFLRCVWED